MINNLSGHGVQEYVINQQANQTTKPAVTDSNKTTVAAVEKATATPATIVKLGTLQDDPVTYSTAGGIDKPPP